LLDTTLIRVGNEEYARQNHSFGLSTMRHRHVTVHGAKLDFHFRGKSGKSHQVSVADPRVAAVVRRLQHLPGQVLFQYVDARGRRVNIGSTEINDYLREISGAELTAKDFRTWAATLETARLLALAAGGGKRRTKARVQEAIAAVAARLGNTPAICRKSYVHPGIVAAYLAGTSLEMAGSSAPARQRALLRLLRAS
jgi:DNA topoisomerase-1